MHYNTLFQNKEFEKFSVEGHSPNSSTQTPPPRRLRRLDRRAFGAPHLSLSALGFMRPAFSVPIVGNPNCD